MYRVLELAWSWISQKPGQSQQSQSPEPENFVGTEYPDPPDLTRYIVKVNDQSSDRGAFGDVYKCRLQFGGEEVAVKALRFYPSDEPEDTKDGFNKMLRRELGIWKRLEHVNIVPFLGIARDFQWEGSVSLVSSWMPNETLRKFLTKYDDKLGTGHRLNILLDIAKGLNYLHSFEVPIVHGDLNPNNVLLDVYYTARLVDFGYASLAGNTPQALAYLQRLTTAPGALPWSAPEQHDPEWESGLTVKSDIYSFGCIGLQVLSGQQPWSEVPINNRTTATIQARLRDRKNPARPRSRAIDNSHWALIQRCWSPLQQRPVADEIVGSIDKFMRHCRQSGRIRDLFIPSSPNQLHSPANQSSLSVLGQSEFTADRSSKGPGTATQPRIPDSTKSSDVDTVTNNDVSMNLSTVLSSQVIGAHERQQCETLYAQGQIYDAAKLLLQMKNTISDDSLIVDWVTEFTQRCASKLQMIGDEAASAEKYDDAVTAYSIILSLTPSPPSNALMKWASTLLIRRTVDETLCASFELRLPKFHIFRAICDILKGDGRDTEAIKCFRRMQSELPDDVTTHTERARWEIAFRQHSADRLEKRGDMAMGSKNHDAAIECYSNALSLDPINTNDIIVKCCKTRVCLLEDGLVRVDQEIERDPSSYKGYKKKYSVLHSMGRYGEAFEAFEAMLSKIEGSSEVHTRELLHLYINSTSLIRDVIEQTIQDIPSMLIDVTTGCLYDRIWLAAAFEGTSIYNELRSSMITRERLDYSRVRREVETFYQYAMFSHKWQPGEPTFQSVQKVSESVQKISKPVYVLPPSPPNTKLVKFCKLVRTRRFRWAWSDTCCINKDDRGMQQESIVAMFRWYRGASLTVVHLLGVLSDSQEIGSLWRSIWNTRGWTYQEYLASKVIQFYTEDWKPYLGLDVFNHKEHPTIVSEMEQVTNFAARELAMLEPGLDRVREKLFLASKRQTTREEDIAYSLFGIFGVALPVIYGEGNQAIGRLLEHILTRSGNVTLLAWTGISGSHHSYLPVDLSVYDQVVPPHIPQPVDAAEMDRMVMALKLSSDLSQGIELYERLHDLPPLSLVAGRLRLPGLVFRVTNLRRLSEPDSDRNIHVYRATTALLGEVTIKTKDNLSAMRSLIIIHPWIFPLIDRDFSYDSPLFDLDTRALQLIVRLRQPFGALLLASQGRAQYKRVATDSLIVARVGEETVLSKLMDSVRTVDVQ